MTKIVKQVIDKSDSFVNHAGHLSTYRVMSPIEFGSVSSTHGICAIQYCRQLNILDDIQLYLDFVYNKRRYSRMITLRRAPTWRSISIFARKFMREVVNK